MNGDERRMKRYWLVKSEPSVYSFDRLVEEKRTVWDGIRSYEARNNLREMAKGDLLLFYHSNEGKAVVGVASVARAAYPDPTDDAWSVIDVEAVGRLKEPVTLTAIKAHPKLKEMAVAKKSRLSVTPVLPEEYERVVAEGGGLVPAKRPRAEARGQAGAGRTKPAPKPGGPRRATGR